MSIFLGLKQIVDMIYQLQILDYAMVLLVIAMVSAKISQKKYALANLQAHICVADCFLLGMGVLYTISFLNDFSHYGVFFKCISVILLYLMGRLYGSEILQNGRICAVIGYAVVYANLIRRFFQFKCQLFLHGPDVTYLNCGGFYYYKTDYAVGVLTAVLFIYLFSKLKVLKWITVLPIASYMIFYSGARSVKIVFALFYVFVVLREISVRRNKEQMNKKFHLNIWTSVILLTLLICFILIQLIPWEQIRITMEANEELSNRLENIFHSRHIVIMDILQYFQKQSFALRTFGIDLGNEWKYTSNGTSAHSVYIRTLYSTGYVGCICISLFVLCIFKRLRQTHNKELKLCIQSFWSIVLFVGLSVETLQMTQMSWYAMLFAGALMTDTNNATKKEANPLTDKVYRKLHNIFWQKWNPGKWSLNLYPSYRHYKRWIKKQKNGVKSEISVKENLFLTQEPNKGAGIGHQMANWICGFYYAGYFGVKHAYSPFPKESWDTFLGFGENEITASELLEQGYRKRRLPYFNEKDHSSIELIQGIIDSYAGKKIIFYLELDQFYADQYGAMEHISQKFHEAKVRENEHLVFDEDCINIAVHIRRGDIVVGQDTQDPALTKRWVTTEYYANGMKQLSRIMESLGKTYRFYVFSQGKEEDFPELQGISNITFCLDMGAKESFLHMVKADVLMTSKSSFSYKPALLSKGIRIVPNHFWHGYPEADNWFVINDSGELNEAQVERFISMMKDI